MESKFEPSKYINWMQNIISIVNNFNLVIYTDENTLKYININNNPKIKVIIKNFDKFYNYKYKDFWIKNHSKNFLLNNVTCWELNMLWSEKIAFVKDTIDCKYFDTEFYGWCDIGYFRNRNNDTHTFKLMNWPNPKKINNLDKNKIVYACINNSNGYLKGLTDCIKNKNANGLPIIPINPHQNSIAGGFFILHKSLINFWFNLFDDKLSSYFKNDYLVKDDQIIIADCIFSDLDKFMLFRENNPAYDNWFMFQRIFN